MKTKLYVLMIVILLLVMPIVRAERVKDIVDLKGVRGNPLVGIGLIIGLADTGDSTLPSQQVLASILRDAGIIVSPDDLSGGNIAIVMVTAQLGPFDREGTYIDVDVSSIGDAESLQGGMLLPTPLKGLDGQVYAVAQGSVFIGGWVASGNQASISKNHQTIGRIPAGAIVEQEEISTFYEYIGDQRYVTLNLRNNDFSTARRIEQAIETIYPDSTSVIDAGTIRVQVPSELEHARIAAFVDDITALQVKVDTPAVVVINERTGTIVVGEKVGISEVAISQGSLVVKVKETQIVSQPNTPFTDGATTEKVPETLIGVEEQPGYLVPVPRVVTVSELAKTLNAIGATPRDLIAIFNALKKAGALQAKLEIM